LKSVGIPVVSVELLAGKRLFTLSALLEWRLKSDFTDTLLFTQFAKVSHPFAV